MEPIDGPWPPRDGIAGAILVAHGTILSPGQIMMTCNRYARAATMSSVYRKGGLDVPQVSGVRAGLDSQVGEARCHPQEGRAQILLAGVLRRAEELGCFLDIHGDMIGFHVPRGITPVPAILGGVVTGTASTSGNTATAAAATTTRRHYECQR